MTVKAVRSRTWDQFEAIDKKPTGSFPTLDMALSTAHEMTQLSTAQTANSKKIVRGDRQRRGQETDRREALHSSGVLLKGASDTAGEPAKKPPKTNPTFAAIYSEAGANAGPVEWACVRTEPQPPSRPSSKLSRRRQRRTCSPDLKTSSSTAAATATTERFSGLGESEVRKVFDDGADAARSSFRPRASEQLGEHHLIRTNLSILSSQTFTDQQSTHRLCFNRLFKTKQAEAKKKLEKMAGKGVRGAEEKDGGCDDPASDCSESASAMLRIHRSSSSSSSSRSVELKGMKGSASGGGIITSTDTPTLPYFQGCSSEEKPFVGGSEDLEKKDGAATTVRLLLVHERVRAYVRAFVRACVSACLRVCARAKFAYDEYNFACLTFLSIFFYDACVHPYR